MVKVNENFLRLPGGYLFSETARRVEAWKEKSRGQRLVRLGIGDVTQPISGAVAASIGAAAAELATAEGFRGYGPEQGYSFLREILAEQEYRDRGAEISADEIFISDGAKSDCGGILDLFGSACTAAVCDPVYPAYVDAAAMAGFAGWYDNASGRWSRLYMLPCREENGFIPQLPEGCADLVYLCFPNNPTGAVASKEQLQQWVDWANASGAVLLYDGAYEAFITDAEIPHSIFEMDGAGTCAIEFRSFSKMAGFTGLRCASTVIPKALKRNGVSLHGLWSRRQAARFNGVAYPIQRGAAAVYTPEGTAWKEEVLRYYKENGALLKKGLEEMGLRCFGGTNAPYVWVKTPDGMSSWACFDLLLDQCAVVTTPGVGFGREGEGYLRLSAFGAREDIREAIERIRKVRF